MTPTREFFQLFSSRFFGSLGFQLFLLCGSFLVFRETKSALLSGLTALALLGPSIFLPLVIGAWIDRVQKIGRLYFWIQWGFVACALVCAAFPLVPVIVASFFCASILRTLRTTAFYTMAQGFSSSFSAKRLALASTLSWQLPLIFGPALFSVFEASFSARSLMIPPIFFFAVAVLAVAPQRGRTSAAEKKSNESSERSEEVSLWLRASLMDASVMGCAVFASLLPFLLESVREDPGGLGFLRAGLNVGVFVGASLFSRFVPESKARAVFIAAMILACAISFGVTGARNFSQLLVACAAFGLLDSVSIVYRERLFFSACRRGSAGRLSTYGQLMNSFSEDGGEARAGFVVGVLGLVPGIQISAIVGLVVCGAFLLQFARKKEKRLRKGGFEAVLIPLSRKGQILRKRISGS